MHVVKIVKKKQKQKIFFFIKFDHKSIFLYTIRKQINCSFKIITIFSHVCILKKNIDLFLLSQSSRHGVLGIDFFRGGHPQKFFFLVE